MWDLDSKNFSKLSLAKSLDQDYNLEVEYNVDCTSFEDTLTLTQVFELRDFLNGLLGGVEK